MSLLQEWFTKNVTEDIDDINKISDIAMEKMNTNLMVAITGKSYPIGMYGILFNTLLEAFVYKRNHGVTPDTKLNVADRFTLQYSNVADGICIYMEHCEFHPIDYYVKEPSVSIDGLIRDWFSRNISHGDDLLPDILRIAVPEFEKIAHVAFNNRDIILPLFCTIHDCIVAYARMKKICTNRDSAEINIANLYKIQVKESTDTGKDIITFTMNTK